jgi:hypothetical protein
LFLKRIPYVQTLSRKHMLNYQQHILVGIRLAGLLHPDTTGLAYQQMLPSTSVTATNANVQLSQGTDRQGYCIRCQYRNIYSNISL